MAIVTRPLTIVDMDGDHINFISADTAKPHVLITNQMGHEYAMITIEQAGHLRDWLEQFFKDNA